MARQFNPDEYPVIHHVDGNNVSEIANGKKQALPLMIEPGHDYFTSCSTGERVSRPDWYKGMFGTED